MYYSLRSTLTLASDSIMNHSVLQLLFMLSVTSFSKGQSISWPPWIHSESCYERIIICERYDSSNPTCSNQAGHLGSNGFRVSSGKNILEIEGPISLLFIEPDGDLAIGGSVWKTTIDQTERTSVLTSSYDIDPIECSSMGLSIPMISAETITAVYSFLCGSNSEVIEPAQTGIIFFKDLGTCNNSQNKHVILVAVRQGINPAVCMALYAIYASLCRPILMHDCHTACELAKYLTYFYVHLSTVLKAYAGNNRPTHLSYYIIPLNFSRLCYR